MRVALAVMLLCGVAAAQSANDEVRIEAKQHADRGAQFFTDNDFVAAAVEYDQAAQLYATITTDPDGTVRDPDAHGRRQVALLQEATAYAQAELSVEALDAFTLLRDQFGASMGPNSRAQIDDAIAKLRERVGEVTLTGVPAGAEVRVDGRLATAVGGHYRISAGNHGLEIHAATFKPYLGRFTLAGAQKLVVDVKLELSDVPARVRFEVNAEPAIVEVDGKRIGTAPIEYVATPGSHKYKVTSESYRDNEGDFTAVPNQRDVIHVGMLPRRSPLGIRFEPFFAMYIALKSDTPVQESLALGAGVKLFHSYLRFRNVRFGIEFEGIDRPLDSFAFGIATEWCPDALSNGIATLCPVDLSLLDSAGGKVANFTPGSGAGRLGAAFEVHGFDTLLIRFGAGLGYESYKRDAIVSLTFGTFYVGFSIGMDL